MILGRKHATGCEYRGAPDPSVLLPSAHGAPSGHVQAAAASQIILLAASSLGKCPRVLMILRSRALMLSIALVGVDHFAHCPGEGEERNHL